MKKEKVISRSNLPSDCLCLNISVNSICESIKHTRMVDSILAFVLYNVMVCIISIIWEHLEDILKR